MFGEVEIFLRNEDTLYTLVSIAFWLFSALRVNLGKDIRGFSSDQI